jgi:DNA-binding response OmpR family regulator
MSVDSIPAGNVLIVDDTPANLRLLSSILSDRGYLVRPAPNGALALRAIESSPPDLIILDVNMPDMNGYDIARQLKSQPETRDIPIIFVSALGEVEDKVRAFRAGGVDYITKPFQVEEVLARVHAHISLRVLQKKLTRANEELERQVTARTAQLVALNRANQRFVPREILHMLGRSNIAEARLGDQIHRVMAILFSDLFDFTGFSETMTAQETFGFINGYLGRISPLFHSRGGVIDKYIGDEVMVLFPGRVDDALDSAIDLQRVLAKYSQQRIAKGRRPIRAGVGIHIGGLMVGIVGEEERMQGTVISDAVNIASRLQGLTRKYGCPILVSEQTLQGVQFPDSFHARLVDKVRMRGKTALTTVYEIFDGDDPALFESKLSTLAQYEEGLNLFHARDFSGAHKRLSDVVQKSPSDSLAVMYLERAAAGIRGEIPEVWEGVERRR